MTFDRRMNALQHEAPTIFLFTCSTGLCMRMYTCTFACRPHEPLKKKIFPLYIVISLVIAICGLNLCIFCYRPCTSISYLTFCARKPLLLTTSGYNYNSKTKRHSDLRFEPFCDYRYCPGANIIKLTFCPRKPQIFTTSGYLLP